MISMNSSSLISPSWSWPAALVCTAPRGPDVQVLAA